LTAADYMLLAIYETAFCGKPVCNILSDGTFEMIEANAASRTPSPDCRWRRCGGD
jgi:hypothetical protein